MQRPRTRGRGSHDDWCRQHVDHRFPTEVTHLLCKLSHLTGEFVHSVMLATALHKLDDDGKRKEREWDEVEQLSCAQTPDGSPST